MGPDRHCCVCGPPGSTASGPRERVPPAGAHCCPGDPWWWKHDTAALMRGAAAGGGGRRVHGPAPPGSAPSPPDSQHHSVLRADDGLGLERVRSGVFGADRAEHLLSVSPGISESWPCSVWCMCSVFTVNSRSKARRNRSRMYGHHQVLDTT